jgi:hypothetical protein
MLQIRFLLAGGLCSAFAAAAPPPKPNPKKPVDYVAWVNQEWGSSVTSNAADRYAQAFAAYVESGISKETIDAALESWSETDLRAPADWVNANEHCLVLLAEAAKTPGCFFRAASSDGSLMAVMFPNVEKTRSSAKLLAVRARRRIADGETAAALEDLSTLLQFSRHLESQPALIHYLVGLMLGHHAHKTLREAPDHTPNPFNFDSVLQTLRKLDAPPPTPMKTMVCERANYWDILQRFLRDSDGDGLFDHLAVQGLYEGSVKPIKFDDAVKESDDYFTKAASLFTGSHAAATAKAQALDDERTARKGELLSVLAPSFARASVIYRRALAERNGTRVVLGCHAYRAKNKRWPADLSAALPGEPSDIRKDPFSDGDLIYRVTGDEMTVYSVGANGKDDGGKAGPSGKNPLDEVYWPVAQGP